MLESQFGSVGGGEAERRKPNHRFEPEFSTIYDMMHDMHDVCSIASMNVI